MADEQTTIEKLKYMIATCSPSQMETVIRASLPLLEDVEAELKGAHESVAELEGNIKTIDLILARHILNETNLERFIREEGAMAKFIRWSATE